MTKILMISIAVLLLFSKAQADVHSFGPNAKTMIAEAKERGVEVDDITQSIFKGIYVPSLQLLQDVFHELPGASCESIADHITEYYYLYKKIKFGTPEEKAAAISEACDGRFKTITEPRHKLWNELFGELTEAQRFRLAQRVPFSRLPWGGPRGSKEWQEFGITIEQALQYETFTWAMEQLDDASIVYYQSWVSQREDPEERNFRDLEGHYARLRCDYVFSIGYSNWLNEPSCLQVQARVVVDLQYKERAARQERLLNSLNSHDEFSKLSSIYRQRLRLFLWGDFENLEHLLRTDADNLIASLGSFGPAANLLLSGLNGGSYQSIIVSGRYADFITQYAIARANALGSCGGENSLVYQIDRERTQITRNGLGHFVGARKMDIASREIRVPDKFRNVVERAGSQNLWFAEGREFAPLFSKFKCGSPILESIEANMLAFFEGRSPVHR